MALLYCDSASHYTCDIAVVYSSRMQKLMSLMIISHYVLHNNATADTVLLIPYFNLYNFMTKHETWLIEKATCSFLQSLPDIVATDLLATNRE